MEEIVLFIVIKKSFWQSFIKLKMKFATANFLVKCDLSQKGFG